jgi:hypothetical protein
LLSQNAIEGVLTVLFNEPYRPSVVSSGDLTSWVRSIACNNFEQLVEIIDSLIIAYRQCFNEGSTTVVQLTWMADINRVTRISAARRLIDLKIMWALRGNSRYLSTVKLNFLNGKRRSRCDQQIHLIIASYVYFDFPISRIRTRGV